MPVVYGFVEAIAICIFLCTFWKLGWSKAPKNEKFCTVITKSYELRDKEEDGEDDKEKVGEDEDVNENEYEEDWNPNEDQGVVAVENISRV